MKTIHLQNAYYKQGHKITYWENVTKA